MEFLKKKKKFRSQNIFNILRAERGAVRVREFDRTFVPPWARELFWTWLKQIYVFFFFFSCCAVRVVVYE